MIDDDEEIIVFPGGGGSQPGSNTVIGPLLSSEVGDLQFDVDGDLAQIHLSYNDGVPFFEAALCAFSGKCTLFQVGDLIADYMKANGLSFGRFYVSESRSNSTAVLGVLLSDRVITGGFRSASRFPLVSSSCFVVPNYGVASMYFYTGGADISVSAEVRGLADDGSDVSFSVDIPGAYKVDGMIAAIDISPSSVMDYVHSFGEWPFELVSVLSLKVSIVYGGMYFSASIYVVDDPDMLEFRFRNNFGLFENIYFHAESIPDIDSDAQVAVIGNSVLQYDVEFSQSYSVQVSNLSASEWQRISQFISSREIYDAYGRQILLSDVSTEMCKTYDGLGSFKFSYRFADSRLITD